MQLRLPLALAELCLDSKCSFGKIEAREDDDG